MALVNVCKCVSLNLNKRDLDVRSLNTLCQLFSVCNKHNQSMERNVKISNDSTTSILCILCIAFHIFEELYSQGQSSSQMLKTTMSVEILFILLLIAGCCQLFSCAIRFACLFIFVFVVTVQNSDWS